MVGSIRGEGEFTRRQLAILTQLMEAALVERSGELDPQVLIPGTVESYDVQTRMTSVVIDGDTGSTLAFNKQYVQLAPADRVFLQFVPTGGVFVDGIIRAAGALGAGCTLKSLDGVEFPENEVAPAVGMDRVYDPAGMYDPATGVITIPEYGLWAATFVIERDGGGFTRCFAEAQIDGFPYRSANFWEGDEADPNNATGTGPLFLDAGAPILLNVYHLGTGGPSTFRCRADIYKVQPGQFTPPVV